MEIGHKSHIELVVDEFGADVKSLTQKKLSCLHFAAISDWGYLSLLMLLKNYKLEPSI